MKKFSILVLVLALSFGLSGCRARSIGFIGGADGPTSIIVSKENKGEKYKSEKGTVKAIMIDGSIYFETGEENDIEGRCGTLDGSFKKAVDVWELPKNDGEANFELKNKDYSGYQLGFAKNTIEVLIGDDWEIFKKIDENEKNLTQYKYILKLEGNTEYNHEEAEYIILSNSLDITANDVVKSMLSSNSKDHLDIYIVSQKFD